MSNNLLLKSAITIYDITNAEYISGTDLAGLRGKKQPKKSNKAETEECVIILEYLYKLHKFVTLMVDVMFFNVYSFKITSTKRLKFVTFN